MVLIIVAFATASCSVEPQLLPVAESGVRVVVEGDVWRGRPARLTEVVTPVRITVENASGRPLRLTYADLSLDGKKHYPALGVVSRDPVVSVRQNASLVLVANGKGAFAPRFGSRGFFVAQFYKAQYPRYEPWPRPLRSVPLEVERPYLGADLPSDDMLVEAMPEGVLENNGFVTAFVYFQRVEPKETRLNFNLKLADPDTGEQFGVVTIPLAVQW